MARPRRCGPADKPRCGTAWFRLGPVYGVSLSHAGKENRENTNAAFGASSSRITSSMHAMWMCTLPEGFEWDFLDLSPFSMMLQLISICCMEHERDGLLRERLDLSPLQWMVVPAFAFWILLGLCLHLQGARRILTDADLEEWILLEDRSPVFLDEVHAFVQARGRPKYWRSTCRRCCIPRRIPFLDH